MKKIYTAVACALIGSAAIAQHSQMPSAPEQIQNNKLKVGNHAFHAQSGNSRATSTWMNYGLELDDPNGFTPGMAAPAFMLLFNDSNIIVGQYSDGSTAYPQFHKAAVMLDPKNMPITASNFNQSQTYTIDSLAIAYAYLRALPTNVVDTLTIQVIKHDVALEYTIGGTETYQDITYIQTSNTITPSQVLGTYTYLLQETDSSNYVNEILLATPGIAQQTGTNRIGVVITYKAGYSYSITDSINAKNSFYLFSYEQNGASTDPTFYGTVNVGTSDLNCSYALPTSVRYDYNANGWNGYFIPTWAWTTPYAYEHHIVSFHVVQGTNIDENSLISSANVYPNPTSGSTNISYNLKNDADVSFEVTDITGKVILLQNEGSKHAGSYNSTIDTQNIAEGTYFVTVRAGESKQVTRLVVAK